MCRINAHEIVYSTVSGKNEAISILGMFNQFY